MVSKRVPKLSIADVLTFYGMDVPPRRSGRQKVRCCFHPDAQASASIDYGAQRFRCFGCGVAGDGIDLICQQEGVSVPRAVELAETVAGLATPDEPPPGRPERGLFE